jgi:hypothetical protein
MAVPDWAIPPSVRYGQAKRSPSPQTPTDEWFREHFPIFKEALQNIKAWPRVKLDVSYANATSDQRAAYDHMRIEILKAHGELPNEYDMDVFLKLASTVSAGKTSGNESIDRAMLRTLSALPSVASTTDSTKDFYANNAHRLYSFSFPFTYAANGKSHSEENINTRFSPEGFNGTFTGMPDYFAQPNTTTKKPRSPSRGGRFGAKGGARHSTTHSFPTNGPMDPPNFQQPFVNNAEDEVKSTNEAKFSKEEWEQKLKDGTWSFPGPPSNPPGAAKGPTAKPRGRKASRATAKPANLGTQEHPHFVDDDDTVEVEGADGRPEHGAPLSNDDGDAMDIDSTPPGHDPATTSPTQPHTTKEARHVKVPISNWHQQQQQQAQMNGHRRTASARVPREPNLKTTLNDFANVAPFATSATEGLADLSGLGTSLPFRSQASSTLPTHPVAPETLSLPAVPKAPERPTKLTKESWHKYVAAFGSYIAAFHAFDHTMVQHFTIRDRQNKEFLANGTGWLEAVGDTVGSSGPSGFAGYFKGVLEDRQAREGWNIGHERHYEAVNEFNGVREHLKKLVATGALADR